MAGFLSIACIVSSWILLFQISGGTELEPVFEDDTLRFIQNSVKGSCKCSSTTCGCCQTVSVLHERKDVCINVKYLKKEIGVLLTVTWGGKVIYSKEVSVQNPPAVCLKVPLLKKVGKLCIQLYNMHVGGDGLSGCSRITLKVAFIKVIKLDLGCFKIPFANDEIKLGEAPWNKELMKTNDERSPLLNYFRYMTKHIQNDENELYEVLMREIMEEDTHY
ncbi:uncharacterized protein LOC133172703 isoform X2 [Saccostrea echinata]|uniref:uncharacterized protein LOC133172703 isoform X2 n=1 Tax=Saccostrea echinata TaxID=191078 RepID=UPI002A8356AD|nr:uncharacterized protein LOC133172703 isoform X2 [Saccostrea echinata]